MTMDSTEYTFDEFRNHFNAMRFVRDYEVVSRESEQVRIGDEKCFELNCLRIMDYMSQIYTDREEQIEKGKLLALILSYLAEHAERFDIDELAVLDSKGEKGLISEPLLRAVHHIFTTHTLAELGHGSDPVDVIKLAKKIIEERY